MCFSFCGALNHIQLFCFPRTFLGFFFSPPLFTFLCTFFFIVKVSHLLLIQTLKYACNPLQPHCPPLLNNSAEWFLGPFSSPFLTENPLYLLQSNVVFTLWCPHISLVRTSRHFENIYFAPALSLHVSHLRTNPFFITSRNVLLFSVSPQPFIIRLSLVFVVGDCCCSFPVLPLVSVCLFGWLSLYLYKCVCVFVYMGWRGFQASETHFFIRAVSVLAAESRLSFNSGVITLSPSASLPPPLSETCCSSPSFPPHQPPLPLYWIHLYLICLTLSRHTSLPLMFRAISPYAGRFRNHLSTQGQQNHTRRY